jgi:aryl-alcohol dehydrogenase-like predicted oxidoreductase
MSLPVAATVIGMPKVEHIEQNVAVAKGFKPLTAPEMRKISGDLSEKNRNALNIYFRDHVDA